MASVSGNIQILNPVLRSVVGGGSYVSGTIVTKNSIISSTNNSAAVSWIQKFEWPESCDVRRGGPRSRIYCEVFKRVPHKEHIGRSKSGRWYAWKESD
jgi:hypothetical protein